MGRGGAVTTGAVGPYLAHVSEVSPSLLSAIDEHDHYPLQPPSSTESMSTTLVALQDRLQTASTEFQKIQSDMTSAVEARQRLEAQQSENELVKKVRAASPLLALRSYNDALAVGILHVDGEEHSLQAHRSCPRAAGPSGGEG